jgi:hypothetical protein
MQPMIKRFFGILLLVSGLQTLWGFGLGGPLTPNTTQPDGWQVPTIGYELGGDVNTPKNIGEEYRRNTPVMYYAFDANFYDYFGPEGATGVGNAFAILNALTNVDNYSRTLAEFPLESRSQNYQAQALGLLDLKSVTLGLMAEQLGLIDPIRYSWTLRNRLVGPGGCPNDVDYNVVQRNFEIAPSSLTQLQYSPYVNDVLYTYQILEFCTGPNPLAIALPYSVDPLADTYSPVASYVSGALGWGDFYTGLTRDDVAGLRYLLTTNNVNWETPAAESLLIITNTSVEELFPLYGSGGGTNSTAGGTNGASGGGWYNAADGLTYGTYSYPALLTFAQTNNPANLQAAYPGLQFTTVSNYYALVWITNTVSYFTNFYGGVGPSLVIKKQKQQVFQQYFVYRFDNIVTNLYSKTTQTKIQTLTVAPMIGAPAGSPSVTNVSTKKVTLKVPNGDFYIIPTGTNGTFCGLDVVASFAFTNYTTNVITSTTATNTATTGSTNNTAGSTNFTGYAYTQIQIIPSISHVYVTHPVTCDTTTNAATGLLRGIGRVSYVRADYDSLLGQYWQPVTNDYQMTMITNSRATTMSFRRVVTVPDFLFTTADQLYLLGDRNLNFNEANVLPRLAGPGTITTPTVFTYNRVGPMYYNYPSDTMDGTSYFTKTPGGDITDFFYIDYFVWANFDGSTNAPVVFPNGTSIEDLQNQLLVKVSPTTLPLGIAGVPYTPTTFTATGGSFTQPFAWSAWPLPEGMTLSSDGTLSGTPTQPGTYDFTLTLTDAVARSVDWNYSIIIQ